MTSPNSSFAGDLYATTIQEIGSELMDNILNKNALTAWAKSHGLIVPKDGGPSIVRTIEYAENGSYGRYSGADTLNTTQNEVFSAFQFPWRQSSINVQWHGREILQNAGRSQRKDLVKSRIKNAKSSFENQFNIDSLSDGTASNQVTGMQAMIAALPTSGSIGGVDRLNYSFARNQYYRATTDGGAALSPVTIVGHMDSLDLLLVARRANTSLILSDELTFKYYEGNVHALQRITKSDGAMAKLGFRAYAYKNAEVVFEPGVCGMPSATQFWLDHEVIELNPHAERNLVDIGERKSYNQDAGIRYLAWMGNWTCSNFRRLGTLNNN